MNPKIKVLNLYAGIGGNRKLWENVDVTAVEINPKIAKIYQEFFPNDHVIVADAHQFLLEHFKEFDFIWSSPPCPSHSVTNHFLHAQGTIRYPDMTLYQEIIFLQHWFKGKWAVENVKPYYEPLIKAQECGRHLFWVNFNIEKIKGELKVGRFGPVKIKGRTDEKNKIKRNCVDPKIGLHVFNMAFKDKQVTLDSIKESEKG